MNGNPKWLGILLALWGLFLMGASLWRATQVGAAGPAEGGTVLGMTMTGVTGVLAGLGILAVSRRLDQLYREREGRPDRRL